MLCLPEFDTYNTLRRYAENPDGIRNIVALKLLKRVTLRRLQWRVLNCRLANENTAGQLYDMVLGRNGTPRNAPKTNMLEMNEKELMDMYNKALDAVGLTVDPEALAKAQQQQEGG
jgi:hypothetical protein